MMWHSGEPPGALMFEWKCSLILFPDAVNETAEVGHKRAAFESAWWHRTCWLSERRGAT